eukprot:Selendium_serpulae@DN4960_c2_g2_i2.p1
MNLIPQEVQTLKPHMPRRTPHDRPTDRQTLIQPALRRVANLWVDQLLTQKISLSGNRLQSPLRHAAAVRRPSPSLPDSTSPVSPSVRPSDAAPLTHTAAESLHRPTDRLKSICQSVSLSVCQSVNLSVCGLSGRSVAVCSLVSVILSRVVNFEPRVRPAACRPILFNSTINQCHLSVKRAMHIQQNTAQLRSIDRSTKFVGLSF